MFERNARNALFDKRIGMRNVQWSVSQARASHVAIDFILSADLSHRQLTIISQALILASANMYTIKIHSACRAYSWIPALTAGITMSEGERKCYARSLTTIVMYCLSQIYWHLCLVAFGCTSRCTATAADACNSHRDYSRRSFSRAYTSRFRGNIRSTVGRSSIFDFSLRGTVLPFY